MIVADADVDPLGKAACESLANTYAFALVRYFKLIDSTNSAALADLETDASTPRLYLADVQTSGRGRHGRSWLADAGTLTFSLVVPMAMYNSRQSAPISIAAGVAMARTIDHLAAPFRARLKWPNDVYLDGGKVAGILIEAAPITHGAVVVGIGLNVATDFNRPDFVPAAPAKSICELTQRNSHRYQWLVECIEQLFEAFACLEHQPQEIIEEYRSRCLLQGHSIHYLRDGTWIQGECEGIDTTGALCVRTNQTLHRLTSGEVHRIRQSIHP